MPKGIDDRGHYDGGKIGQLLGCNGRENWAKLEDGSWKRENLAKMEEK